MRSYVVALVMLVCLACGSSTDDQNMIFDNRMSFNVAIADHDTSKMVTYWTDDIIVVTSRNARFVGKEQYAAGLANEFKSKEGVVYVRTPELIDIFPAWEMAAESGRWIGTWKNGTESIEVTGTYYAKWKKVGSEWLINAEVYTPLRCVGGQYCDGP